MSPCPVLVTTLQVYEIDRNALICLHNLTLWLKYFLLSLGSKSGRSFLDRCTAFIGENALECVKTSAFLNLPKSALIHLVSSDYVSCWLFVKGYI